MSAGTGWGAGGEMLGVRTGEETLRLGAESVKAAATAVNAAKAQIKRHRELVRTAADVDALRKTFAAHDYAETTCDKYARIVRAFLDCVGSNPTWDDVNTYHQELVDTDSRAVARVTLCALRALFDKILGWGITVGIRHAPRPRPVCPATPRQIESLFAAAESEQETQLLTVLFTYGLRSGQARMLGRRRDTGDLGRETDCLEVSLVPRSGTEDGTAEPLAFTVLQPGQPHVEWLFVTGVSSHPLSTRTLQRRIGRLAGICGFHTTCTAIRLAGQVALATAA